MWNPQQKEAIRELFQQEISQKSVTMQEVRDKINDHLTLHDQDAKSSSFASENISLQTTVVSSEYWESLISRLAIWIPFLSLEALIAIGSISTANTNSDPDKGQPCLMPRCNSNQFDA